MSRGVARADAGTIELRIDSIAAGGNGVGRHEGVVVFVPRTAPGDVARVRTRRHDRFLRGDVVELLDPSPLRARPACEHYVVDRCGGCQLQHLQYDAQLDAKAAIIHDALQRVGGAIVESPRVTASDQPWRYRRKLTLALRSRDGRWLAGLHAYDDPDRIFAVRDCPITDVQVLAAWQLVLGRQGCLPRARELRGAVRLLQDGFSFTLEGGRRWPGAGDLFDAIPSLLELWWKPEGRPRTLLRARTSRDAAGASFTQVNPAVAVSLRECVVSLVRSHHPERVVDAYAGTGDVAVSLAAAGARVTAIEIDRAAARVCESRLPPGSRTITGAVEDALPGTLPADVVVLNPPRAGIDGRVADVLRSAASALRSIVYVSCNPATLARDVRRLDSFRIRSLRGFDMFPQTAHVETVCELVPAA